MKNAYFVGQITVKNQDKWDEYRSKVPATLAPWNAELIFRGAQTKLHADGSPHPHIVVIRFNSLSDAEGWHYSEEYQAIVPIRLEAADVVGTIYES
jgi:uncharacterized protein (DUF1330 family)